MNIKLSLIAIGVALSGSFTACKDHNPSGSSNSDTTKPFMQPASDSTLPGNAGNTNSAGNPGSAGGTDTSKGKTTTGKDTANKKY